MAVCVSVKKKKGRRCLSQEELKESYELWYYIRYVAFLFNKRQKTVATYCGIKKSLYFYGAGRARAVPGWRQKLQELVDLLNKERKRGVILVDSMPPKRWKPIEKKKKLRGRGRPRKPVPKVVKPKPKIRSDSEDRLRRLKIMKNREAKQQALKEQQND